jgi:hypothetical protein
MKGMASTQALPGLGNFIRLRVDGYISPESFSSEIFAIRIDLYCASVRSTGSCLRVRDGALSIHPDSHPSRRERPALSYPNNSDVMLINARTLETRAPSPVTTRDDGFGASVLSNDRRCFGTEGCSARFRICRCIGMTRLQARRHGCLVCSALPGELNSLTKGSAVTWCGSGDDNCSSSYISNRKDQQANGAKATGLCRSEVRPLQVGKMESHKPPMSANLPDEQRDTQYTGIVTAYPVAFCVE